MKKRSSLRPARIGVILACLMATLPAQADQLDPADFVLSLDARFHQGELIRADRVPAGIRTITYAQYLEQRRLAALAPRRISAPRDTRVGWSIGVFR